ncbi:hypothetical protein [Gordonia araii]|uniref:hypothetical protein n=1 Tax=Gordonia araii TaxID=263909 RepID=UPI00058AFF2B|nr:hypothetical protein [Gordonia araii]NNG99207.1 hypothetical protein [Gordonia araii NBRC 100433]
MSDSELDRSVVDVVHGVSVPKRKALASVVGALCISGFFVFVAVADDRFSFADRVGALMVGSATLMLAFGGICIFLPSWFPRTLRPWRYIEARDSVTLYLEKWAILLFLAAPLTLIGGYPLMTLIIPGSEFFRSVRLIVGLALSVILLTFSAAIVLLRSRVRFTRGSMQIYGRAFGSRFRTDVSDIDSMTIVVRDGIHLDLVVKGKIEVVRKPRFRRSRSSSPLFVRILPLADDMDMIAQLTLIQSRVGVPIRVA